MAIQNVTDAYKIVQAAGDTYNGDNSDQTYSISPSLTGAGETITIIDQGGDNAIELPAGLTITSSLLVSDQAILTLSNGAVIDIRGADTFRFTTEQNLAAGDAVGPELSFEEFAQNVLGVTLDGENLIEGGEVTIGDDTPALPTISLAPTNGETTEGDSGTTSVTFTATLSEASRELVSVDYATASSTAQAGLDFLAASGSLVFSPGTTQQTFDVEIVGDTDYEPDEIFRVELSNPQGAALDQISGFGTIHTISNDDASNEGPMQFGVILNGINENDFSGDVVSPAGDINNDGIDDMLVGAPFAGSNGEAYVVYGQNTSIAGALPSMIDLSALDGTNGFVLTGVEQGGLFGTQASSAGDVNGDGIDDILIGDDVVDLGSRFNVGQTYVIFGRNTSIDGNFSASFDIGSLDGMNGFTLNGIDDGDYSGDSVSSAGDVNGDGVDDIIVGALNADPSFLNTGDMVGEAYIVYGRSSSDQVSFPSSFNLRDLDGTNGFKINGIDDRDRAGNNVSSAGDVNGDGVDDVLINAVWADPSGNTNAGETYVVFGRNTLSDGAFSSELDLESLTGANGFTINGIDNFDISGDAISTAGDVNGDGIDDILVASWAADKDGLSNVGETYVVFGRNTSAEGVFPAEIDLETLNGSNGFKLDGFDGDDWAGSSVSSAGDINGDGVDDILIGARGGDPGGRSGAGETYIVFGRDTQTAGNFPSSFDLNSVNGENGYILNGIDGGDRSGSSVASAGDVNGDGHVDILIGAWAADPNNVTAAGETYVVFGGGAQLAEFDEADGSADGRIELGLLVPTQPASQAVMSLEDSINVLGNSGPSIDYF